ncbi:hypothetical protein [Ralstonia sp.]|uniref:hypothetical protein n=1 Tax=Ralstonia sp. TaxID=54061 RepID=UPI00257CE439|nr:hypothetical protein [Ralstonia sp.]
MSGAEALTVTDGWIDWPGGECPVPRDTLVEVRVRGGEVFRDNAARFRWGGLPEVLGYRLVGERRARPRKHAHYFKDVRGLDEIDVYQVLRLFGVTDQCLGHAIKKLLVAGGRGAGKNIGQDVQEALDTLQRWQEIEKETPRV